jgi:hypothetical protein
MCVIAAKPKNEIITRDVLERCFEVNPDGAGFVTATPQGLLVHKGFFDFEQFYEAYKPYENNACVIHFRIKTHGEKNADMCHPFKVREDLWVAHNGIINIDTKDDPKKSDTWHFVEYVLKPELKDKKALDRPSLQFLFASTIGGSKLAFLDTTGKITIINEGKGEMSGKVWFSNTSYRRPKTVSFTSGGGSTGGGSSYYASRGAAPTKTIYATITDLPSSAAWVIDTLREFEFTDTDIVSEFNSGTAEDLALDLLVFEAQESARKDKDDGDDNILLPVDEIASRQYASEDEAIEALVAECADEAAAFVHDQK